MAGVNAEDKLTNTIPGDILNPAAPSAAPAIRDPSLPAVPGASTSDMNQYAVQNGTAKKPEGGVVAPEAQVVIPTHEEYQAKQDSEIQTGIKDAVSVMKSAPVDAKVKIENGKPSISPPRSFVPEYDRWGGERAAETAFENAGYGPFKAREMSAILTEYNQTGVLNRDVVSVIERLSAAARPKERVIPDGYKDAGKPMGGIYEKATPWQRDAMDVSNKILGSIQSQMAQISEELKKNLSGRRFADVASLNAAAEQINPNALFVLSQIDKDMEASEAKTGKPATGWYAELIDPLKKDQKDMAEKAPMVYRTVIGLGGTEEFARQVSEGKAGAKGEALFQAILTDDAVNIKKGKPSELPVIQTAGPASYAWDDTKKAPGTLTPDDDPNFFGYTDNVMVRARELLPEDQSGSLQDRAIASVQKAAKERGESISSLQATELAKTLWNESSDAEKAMERVSAYTAQQKAVATMAEVTASGANLRVKEDALTKELFRKADKDGGGTSFEEYAAEYVSTVSRGNESLVKDIVRSVKDPNSVHPDVLKFSQALINQWQDAGGKIAKDQITELKSSGQSRANTANEHAASGRIAFANGTKAQVSPGTAIPSEDGKTVYMSATPFSEETVKVVKTADKYTAQLLRSAAERSSSAAASVTLSDSDSIPVMLDVRGRSSVEQMVAGWQTKSLSPETTSAIESAGFNKDDTLKAIRFAHEASPESVQVFLDGLDAIKGTGLIGTEKSGLTKLIKLSDNDIAATKVAIENAAREFAYQKTDVTAVLKSGDVKTTTRIGDHIAYLEKIQDVPAFKNISSEEGKRAYTAVINDKLLGGPLIEQLFALGTKDGFERGAALLLHGLRAVHEQVAINAVTAAAASVVRAPFKSYTPGQIVAWGGVIESSAMSNSLNTISEDVKNQIKLMESTSNHSEVNSIYSTARNKLSEVKRAISASIDTLTNNGLPVGKYITQARDSIDEDIADLEVAGGRNGVSTVEGRAELFKLINSY